MSKEGKQHRKRISSTRLPDDMDIVYRIVNYADARKRKIKTKGGDSMGKIKKSRVSTNLEPHKLFAKLTPKTLNVSKKSALKPLCDINGKGMKLWHPPIKSTFDEVNREEMILVKPVGLKPSEEQTIDFIIESSNESSNTIILHQNYKTFNEPVLEGTFALKASEENITNFIIEGSNEDSNTIIKNQNSKMFNALVMEAKSSSNYSVANKANLSPVEVTNILAEVTEPNINDEVETYPEALDELRKKSKLIEASTCSTPDVSAHPKITDNNISVISHHELENSTMNCGKKKDYSKLDTSAVVLTDRAGKSCVHEQEKEDTITTRKGTPNEIDKCKGALEEDVRDDNSNNEDSDSDNFSVVTVLREAENTCMGHGILNEQNLQEFDKLVDNTVDKTLAMDDDIVVLSEADSCSQENTVVLSEADSCSQDDNTAESNASQLVMQEVKTGEGNLFDTEKQFSQTTSVKEMPNTVQTVVVESTDIKHSNSPSNVLSYKNKSPTKAKENILENGVVLSQASEHTDATIIINDETVDDAIVFCGTRKVQNCLEVDNKHAATKEKLDYGKSLKSCVRDKEASLEFDFEEIGISSSQLQQIENEYNENRGSGGKVAFSQSGVRSPLQPMIPDTPFRPQIQTIPNMAWLQKMRDEKQKLRSIVQEIAKINALVLHARNEIWPKLHGINAEGQQAQEVLRPQAAMAPPWRPAPEMFRPQTYVAPSRMGPSRPANK